MFWLLKVGNEPSELRQASETFQLVLGSNVYAFKLGEVPEKSKMDILEMYRPLPEADVVIMPVGSYSLKTGLTITKVSKWQRRRDLQGVTLRVTGQMVTRLQNLFSKANFNTLFFQDSAYFVADTSGNRTRFSGFYGELWQYFEESSNFRFDLASLKVKVISCAIHLDLYS